jgi:peptide/nickel transport system substrate-binding protein
MRTGGKLAVAGAAALALGGGTVGAALAGDSGSGGTFVYAGSADPIALDGALVSDGESARAIFQMFEGLVALKPGTTEVVPSLATSWKASEDGKTWTFQLRKGVKFHDGTTFDARAVCTNFDRWYNFKGSFQNPSASYYWQTVFGGFKTYNAKSGAPKESLYKSCRVNGANTAVITLTKPSSAFLAGLTLPAFYIASPAALKKYQADKGTVNADGVFRPTGTFATEHPIGTGPFKFQSWKVGDKLVMVRNDDYWGTKAKLKQVVIQPISDPAARLQALQSGEIQGYDNVEPQDIATIQGDDNLQVLDRPPFNVGYVGINQAKKPMNNPLVRQAVAYGLDRNAVVKTFYAGRGEVAKEFMPPNLFGYADDVTTYSYNPDKAKQLLQKAGLKLPVKVDFWYPTDISRQYMPNPKRNFEAFTASMEKSGFKVVPHSAPWSPTYVGRINDGTAGQLYLFGWNGDFGDPDNFLGVLFGSKTKQFGYNNPALFRVLARAETSTAKSVRTRLYQQANRMLMRSLPAVPYVHGESAIGLRKDVQGYIPSPVILDSFSLVSVGTS